MKKLSVKMKITLWYTGLIVIILSAIFTAVLLATDKVLLLGVQNKLEEEVYDVSHPFPDSPPGRDCICHDGDFAFGLYHGGCQTSSRVSSYRI